MFRRKDENGESDFGAVAATENSADNTQQTNNAFGASGTQQPARPAGSNPAPVNPHNQGLQNQGDRQASVRPATFDVSSQNRRPQAAPMQSSVVSRPRPAAGRAERVLTVGIDILLKGEIATCDRLVIEGTVDAKLTNVHTVEIAEAGSFKGAAEIQDAIISGLFDGDLTVRNRLIVRSTGRVTGKITYGEIEIERGGQISGEVVYAAGVRNEAEELDEAA